jgi:hypothetical protein
MFSFVRKLVDFADNCFNNEHRYHTDSEAVIVSCFYNPKKSPYRLMAFHKFYESIKHMNHYIIECSIGDEEYQLPNHCVKKRVNTKSCLWHKESLLNKAIADLPAKYKYVFWVDADVLFTNMQWLTESVNQMRDNDINIVQPFEFCVHLEQDKFKPGFDLQLYETWLMQKKQKHPRLWRSFCANYVTTGDSANNNYDIHGHVGFAWGIKREILDQIPLYDHALVGGADHIIAHAAAGHIPHKCITKSFIENIQEINKWSTKFNTLVKNKIGYSTGELFHIWHGDLESRQYLKRIQEFDRANQTIEEKDENGLYVADNFQDVYVDTYFEHRDRLALSQIAFNDFSNLQQYGYNTSEFDSEQKCNHCHSEIEVEEPCCNEKNPVFETGYVDIEFKENDSDLPLAEAEDNSTYDSDLPLAEAEDNSTYDSDLPLAEAEDNSTYDSSFNDNNFS